MKKNKTKSTGTTDSTKNAKSTTKANIAAAGKELKKNTPSHAANRELKYQYPKDCKTGEEKKEFRRKSRAALRRLNKQIKELAKSNEKADQKLLKETQGEFKTFKESTYTHPENI